GEPPTNRTPTYAAAARKAVTGTALSQAELVRVAFQHRFDRTSSLDRFRNVFAKFTIPKDLPRNRHRTFARDVLRAIGITDGVALISFIGRSVIHLVVAESYHEHVTQALNRQESLLPDFDITSYPAHCTTDAQREEYRTCVTPIIKNRLAILLSTTYGGRRDCVRSLLPSDWIDEVEEMASIHRQERLAYWSRQEHPAPPRPTPAAIVHTAQNTMEEDLAHEAPAPRSSNSAKRPRLATTTTDEEEDEMEETRSTHSSS
ncbi:hypothetical protein HDU96_003822, partial [Phlyctochytrium bullatum]